MTKDDAKEIAKNMSYRNAVYNAMQGKCVPFRKATKIKLKELLSLADNFDKNNITNQEWLSHIQPKDWLRVIHWLYHDYGTQFTDTESAILEWLQHERKST